MINKIEYRIAFDKRESEDFNSRHNYFLLDEEIKLLFLLRGNSTELIPGKECNRPLYNWTFLMGCGRVNKQTQISLSTGNNVARYIDFTTDGIPYCLMKHRKIKDAIKHIWDRIINKSRKIDTEILPYILEVDTNEDFVHIIYNFSKKDFSYKNYIEPYILLREQKEKEVSKFSLLDI